MAVIALGLAALSGVSGCTSPPSPSANVRVYQAADMPNSRAESLQTGGSVFAWESSGWEDTWLEYPAEGTITIHHALGRRPLQVSVYLSFTPDPVDPGLASGDLARIVSVDDATVTLWNHSQNPLFVRVVVE